MAEQHDEPTAATTPDDPKARFREALERKRQGAGRGGGPDAHGESKVHGTSSAAGGKRTFRRKSGG